MDTRSNDGRCGVHANIFVTATGNFNIITHQHMLAMRDQAIVCISAIDAKIQICCVNTNGKISSLLIM
jgi:S-adenosylhomocysteine hydrolase